MDSRYGVGAGNMPPNSFNVNSRIYNSWEMWKMKCISYDPFAAPKRSRKRQIPFTHGSHEVGNQNFFSDKTLDVECHLTELMSKAEYREVISVLSRRLRLYFWDEPEKYYEGELFDEISIDVFPKEVRREFTLSFQVRPFAFGEQNRVRLQRGVNPITYTGTAEAPTLIIIRNTNNHNLVNPVVTAVNRSLV